MAVDPATVVASFIDAVERCDLDAAAALLAEDVTYDNVPVGPLVGRDVARATLESFLAAASEVEWQVLRQVVDGSVVANERVDRFRIGDGWLELPVAGFFEVDDDGRISVWRDYFDLTTYVRQMEDLAGSA